MIFPFSAPPSKKKAMSPIKYIQNKLDKRLVRRLIKKLNSLPEDNWIEYAHTFNKWEFPMDFYNLIPKWWGLKNMDRMYEVIRSVHDAIRVKFGEKEEMKYHHLNELKSTEGAFEDWWAKRNSDEIEEHIRRSIKYESIKWWKDDVFNRLQAAGFFDETITTGENPENKNSFIMLDLIRTTPNLRLIALEKAQQSLCSHPTATVDDLLAAADKILKWLEKKD